MTSQELTTTQSNTELAAWGEYVPVAGAENLSPDDFSLPTLKLVQPNTQSDDAIKHLGHYVQTDTGTFHEAPRALIVGIQKSRILFPTAYAADNKPLCRSDNAVTPRPEFIGQDVFDDGGNIPDTCAECPFSQWGPDGEAPACSLSENWAAILDTGDIVILRLKGTSAAASKMLKNIMRANKLKKRPTYVQLGSKFERTDKGQYYVTTLAAAAAVPPATVLELARDLAGINLAARAADETPEPQAEIGPDGPNTEELPF